MVELGFETRVCFLTATLYSSKLGCWRFKFSTAASLFGELYDLFICDFQKQVALISPGLLFTAIAHENSLEEISRRYFCLNEMSSFHNAEHLLF